VAYWIFKIAAHQEHYPDIPGQEYVYDNTHSVRVTKGDVFLYLDKGKKYSFTATGIIKRVSNRAPTAIEAARTSMVRTVFTAHLSDVVWFEKPWSISPDTSAGRQNRAMLGIVDVNVLGWSQSIPLVEEPMYEAILNLADAKGLIAPSEPQNFFVPDSWGKAKRRKALVYFSRDVLRRSQSACVICGTRQPGLVDAAHLCPYAADKQNRANPANGVCLCAFCHRALDTRLIAIQPDGTLLVNPSVSDIVALNHFTRFGAETRKTWLAGVDPGFLNLTVDWFNDRLAAERSENLQSRHETSETVSLDVGAQPAS